LSITKIIHFAFNGAQMIGTPANIS